MMNRLAGIVCLALLAGAAHAQDKPKRKLAWLLPKTRVAEYSLLTSAGKPIPDRAFWIFGSEFRENGSNRLVIDRYADIPYALLFHLPPNEVRPGDPWEHTAYFFTEAPFGTDGEVSRSLWGWRLWSVENAGFIRPCCARGRYVLRKLEKDPKTDEEVAQIDGEFTLYEVRQEGPANDPKLVVTKSECGTVAVSLNLIVARGILGHGSYTLNARAQERIAVKDDSKVQDKKLSVTEAIELREEVEYGGEKIQKAIDAQLKKAEDWLRKQQREGGDWGTSPTLEDDRAHANVTGLCVRALLAAGAKPDDPAVDRAIRLLRNHPPGTPLQVCRQLTSFLYRAVPNDQPYLDCDFGFRGARERMRKAVPKQDMELVRGLAANLVSRRDVKTSTWAPAEKDPTNILTTRHALEALALAAEAGVDVPLEVWSRVVGLVADAMMEVGPELDLTCQGAEFAAKDSNPPKKYKPLACRFNVADTDPKFRGGNAFTTLAAAEIMKWAEIELVRRGLLRDGQRKILDEAQRGMLAWAQSRKTWRTPPPAEAKWSIRKYEYVHAVASVFSLYGVKKIEGVNWHEEGAYHIMREQFEDGRWDTGYGNAVAETAHAMLFLGRGVLCPSPVK